MLFRVGGGRSRNFATSGGGIYQIIKNAARERPRRHAADEDLGSDSEDTEAHDAQWEDILGAMAEGGGGEEVELPDDERMCVAGSSG